MHPTVSLSVSRLRKRWGADTDLATVLGPIICAHRRCEGRCGRRQAREVGVVVTGTTTPKRIDTPKRITTKVEIPTRPIHHASELALPSIFTRISSDAHSLAPFNHGARQDGEKERRRKESEQGGRKRKEEKDEIR